MVCMASFRSSDGFISSHFDDVPQNCQHVPILWCSFTPFGKNINILKIDFISFLSARFILNSLFTVTPSANAALKGQ